MLSLTGFKSGEFEGHISCFVALGPCCEVAVQYSMHFILQGKVAAIGEAPNYSCIVV